jgi:RNA polymerase sigma factor (TIGR02999 family)
MKIGTVKREAPDLSARLKYWDPGNPESLDVLTPLIYDELRKIAARYLKRERENHTLQPTELAHEAFIKLIDVADIDWQGRAHFFAVAARVVRQILVDHARARGTEKRGGGAERIELTEALCCCEGPDADLLGLDEALRELAGFDEQQSRLIELRFFGGLTIEETGEVLGISAATVKREWALAKAWLSKRLSSGE